MILSPVVVTPGVVLDLETGEAIVFQLGRARYSIITAYEYFRKSGA